jgi:hypothetical protein
MTARLDTATEKAPTPDIPSESLTITKRDVIPIQHNFTEMPRKVYATDHNVMVIENEMTKS